MCDSGFCCRRYCQLTIVIAVPVAFRIYFGVFFVVVVVELIESKASLCTTTTAIIHMTQRKKRKMRKNRQQKSAITILNDILLVEPRDELNLYPPVRSLENFRIKCNHCCKSFILKRSKRIHLQFLQTFYFD